MLRRISLIAFFLLPSLSLFSQTDEIRIKISGFVKADYWIDSRRNQEGVDGMLVYYPSAPGFNSNGIDTNSFWSTHGVALSTRIKLTATGPELFGAKTAGVVEADFTGTTDVALFRLRLANVTFTWSKSNLLVGQAWHPLSIPQFLPKTLSLNTGAPFQCFNRSPQITYTHTLGSFRVLGSINFQSSFESLGPKGKSSIYLKNAVLPNLDFQLQKSLGKSTFGIAYDFKMLRPFITNVGKDGSHYVNENKVKSHSALLFYNYTSEKLFIIAKQLWGQNLTEHLMQGGYGVTSIDSITGIQNYTPSKGWTSILNFCYGTKYKVGGTLGFMKNNGFDKNIVKFYGRDANIKSTLRIAPNVVYAIKNLQLGVECEYNRTTWGKVDMNKMGKVVTPTTVNGVRILSILQYNF